MRERGRGQAEGACTTPRQDQQPPITIQVDGLLERLLRPVLGSSLSFLTLKNSDMSRRSVKPL